MSAKTKVLVSVSVICLIVSIAAVAIVAVYAATHQTVSSKVSVSYVVTDVIGTCEASYRVAGNGSFNTIGEVDFEAVDPDNNTQTVSGDDITLTDAMQYVEFRYHFTNTSDATSGKNYTITLTYTDDEVDDKNVSLEYSFGTSSTANYANTKTTVAANWKGHAIGTTSTVNMGSEYYVFVKISITDIKAGASFSGNFEWAVSSI